MEKKQNRPISFLSPILKREREKMTVRHKKAFYTAFLSIILSAGSITNTAFAENLDGYIAPQAKEDCEWINDVQLSSLYMDHSAVCSSAKLLLAREDLIVIEIKEYSNARSLVRVELSVNALQYPTNFSLRCKEPDVDVYLADAATSFDTYAYKTITYNGRVVDINHEIEKDDPTYRLVHFLWSIEGKESCDKFRKKVKERKEAGLNDSITYSFSGYFTNKDGTTTYYKGYGNEDVENMIETVLSSGGTGDELNIITENGRILPSEGETFSLPLNELEGYTHTAYMVSETK